MIVSVISVLQISLDRATDVEQSLGALLRRPDEWFVINMRTS
jgi:hypothetical protein